MIHWQDATSIDGVWRELDEVVKNERLADVTTVAWLVAVTTSAVVVAGDRQGTQVTSTGLIPLGWLVSVQRLMVTTA